MQSLQSKLSSGLLLSLIVAFSALWLLVSINIQFLAEDYIASQLKRDSESLLSSIRFDENNKLVINISRVDQIYSQPFSGHYYVVTTAKQTVISRSLWDQELKHQTVNTGQEIRILQQGPEQQSLLLMSVGYKKQGTPITITIAEDLNPINKNISQFKYWFAAMAFGMLFVLVILQRIILRKSLTTLNKTQTELKLLQQGRLEKLSTDSPTELQPLINEVNHLLDIMQQRLRRSRDSLSDLAHAIKTPLTVIKQITDSNDIPDSTRNTLIKQTDSIYQISDRILKRARLAGHCHSGTLFSFKDDLAPLIKTLEMIHHTKKIQLTTNLSKNISGAIERQDMLELLGNLLDNAYKWAKKKIIFNMNDDTALHISIEDDGSGVDPKRINALSTRGVRLDEQKQGHGFGLAITTDIVNDYNGSIHFTHSDTLGGFKAVIELPLHLPNR